jgi:hypothetical protein
MLAWQEMKHGRRHTPGGAAVAGGAGSGVLEVAASAIVVPKATAGLAGSAARASAQVSITNNVAAF